MNMFTGLLRSYMKIEFTFKVLIIIIQFQKIGNNPKSSSISYFNNVKEVFESINKNK